MQIERTIRSVRRRSRIRAVPSDGAHVVGAAEATVDGGFGAGAGVEAVFDVEGAGVVLGVGEEGGGDGWAGGWGRGVGAGG